MENFILLRCLKLRIKLKIELLRKSLIFVLYQVQKFLIFQYYNEDEASRYASNSHIVAIQSEMAERAIELLALPEDKPSFLLDIGKFRIFFLKSQVKNPGCGTGISGDAISAAGHYFVGLDISMPMLSQSFLATWKSSYIRYIQEIVWGKNRFFTIFHAISHVAM